MSLETVRSGVATIVAAVSGVSNVAVEEQISHDARVADAERTVDGRTHYWTVAARPRPGDGGAGYLDPRADIVVDGWLGVARDGVDEPSDGPAAALFADVVSAIEDPATAYPGTAIDFEGLAVEGPRVTTLPIGLGTGRAHHIRITATYIYTE